MVELSVLAGSVVFFCVGSLLGDLWTQRKRRLHREAVAWGIWAYEQGKRAAAYERRINAGYEG